LEAFGQGSTTMQSYIVHTPADARSGDRNALDRTELVKDGFSWSAFVFTFVWFFWHRLWLAGIVVLVMVVGFAAGLAALPLARSTAVLAELLLMLLIGLEANAVRGWTYARKGRPAVDVVTARTREEAELKALARLLAVSETGRPVAAAALAPRPYRSVDPVIGLFPDPDRGR
jgi:hypothetical protein